jgi:hypothetical protein
VLIHPMGLGTTHALGLVREMQVHGARGSRESHLERIVVQAVVCFPWFVEHVERDECDEGVTAEKEHLRDTY